MPHWPAFRCVPAAIILPSHMMIFSHADRSRLSIALIRLVIISVCDSVCLSVRTIKPKRLKLKSPNLAEGYSPSRYLAHQWILGQRSKVKVRVTVKRSSGLRELCTSIECFSSSVCCDDAVYSWCGNLQSAVAVSAWDSDVTNTGLCVLSHPF